MAAFGFSLNMLSLFGLVLAIGIVVDDAIVVVENVERHIAAGLAPREAAHKAMDEVTGAVIAIAFGLSAVFVPTAFITGITGQFYRQFALTIAVVDAALGVQLADAQPRAVRARCCSRTARRRTGSAGCGIVLLGLVLPALQPRLRRASSDALRATRSAGSCAAASWRCCVYVGADRPDRRTGSGRCPTGFIPAQDKGYLITAIQLPDGASLERTDAVVRQRHRDHPRHAGRRATRRVRRLLGRDPRQQPERRRHLRRPAAVRGAHRARPHRAERCCATLQEQRQRDPEADIFVIPPPPVQGLGTAGGFKFVVQDRAGRGSAALQEATDELVAAAHTRSRAGRRVHARFAPSTPQLYADVDRVKANMLDVPLGQRLRQRCRSTSARRTSTTSTSSAARSRCAPRPKATSAPSRTTSRRSKTRNAARRRWCRSARCSTSSGGAGPTASCATTCIPPPRCKATPRPATAPGRRSPRSSSSAAQVLPPGMTIEWTDLAYQEKLAGNTALFIFPLCVLFVFLVHSAEYESWSLPLAIILIAPDVPAVRARRRLAPRHGQQPHHADRLRRADRPGGQERRADRRVRQAAGGRGHATASTPPSKRAGCGCGRS